MLEVRGLVTRFHTREGTVHAVSGISYSLAAGEALAIVGESGCGKSVGALSLMGLVPRPGRVEAGEVLLGGRDVLKLPESALRDVRGREIAMVFQDPMTSLNPVLSVGYQLTEGLRRHLRMPAREARERAVELLRLVGIPNADERLSDHPHQFSGGQRQRIVIAMALACRPSVLIADEPTTALDVTIQAQIVALVKGLQAKLGMAILWITHDLALVAGLVDRVAVMYAGAFVEEAPVGELFRDPRHPYTVGLLRSLPSANASPNGVARRRLVAIEGRPPDLLEPPRGCAFAPRCPLAQARCRDEAPGLLSVGPSHASACWRWQEVGREAPTSPAGEAP
ncbi:MAG: ABC transporter ATP-binding protein [Longimicrobiales bacterium]|nr:ABC transporter ATP-binding protein [Longimicrobiales bacterium]